MRRISCDKLIRFSRKVSVPILHGVPLIPNSHQGIRCPPPPFMQAAVEALLLGKDTALAAVQELSKRWQEKGIE